MPSPTSVSQTTTLSHPTQVQVGCLRDCHGTTTLDTSGLTLGQIEQLLGQLQLPPLPPLVAAPGALQNVTQQSSSQSQAGDGASANQAQIADQSNTTVQVAGAPTDQGGSAAVVNRTGQGIWQVQVGCLFDCTGTQQVQQATQSNLTVQAPAGAPAANAVTQLVWQLQIGCLFTCYDAVESQGASATDSTTVLAPATPVDPPAAPVDPPAVTSAPGPAGGSAPAAEGAPAAPAAPVGAGTPVPAVAPAPAPVESSARSVIVGAGLVIREPGRAVFEAVAMGAASASSTAGGGGVIASVSASRSVAAQYERSAARAAHRRLSHRRTARRFAQPRHPAGATARRAAVDAGVDRAPWLALVLAVAAALALTATVRRLHQKG